MDSSTALTRSQFNDRRTGIEAVPSSRSAIGGRVFSVTLSVVTIILGTAILLAVVLRFTEPSAISPWEPAIAMDAMRLLSGVPVYEPGHATHMYGPLLTVFIASVFRIAGLNLLAARVALSLLSFALAGLLSSVLCRGKDRKYWLAAFLLFLGLNFRTNLVLFSAQPDAVAALLGVGGLCLWVARDRVRFGLLISIMTFVCAMLFKQTGAAFALIPVVYTLFWKRTLSGLFTAATPIFSVLATLIAVYVMWPQVFAAIVTVPASIQMKYHQILPTLLYLVVTFPIFLIAVISGLFGREEVSERERWIWAAIVVLVPASVWTMCKSGGSYNSLLPGYLAMTSLIIVKLDGVSTYIGSRPRLAAVGPALGIACAILFSFFVQYHRDLVLLFTRVGNEKYLAVVEYVRRFPGRVVSPQDPTIAYRARGYFGRALFFELDAHARNGNWPDTLPAALQQELEQANFVVQAESYVPTPVFERGLRSLGFRPITIPELSESPYKVWEKPEE